MAERLRDPSFLPADLWPSNPSLDAPYLSSIVSALQRNNGMGVIPYLCAFVPLIECFEVNPSALKAMLMAYPGTFNVRGNQCSLTSIDFTTADRVSCWF